MRTAKEIAEEIEATRQVWRGLYQCNIYGKPSEEISSISERMLEAERKLARLDKERREYINAPISETPSQMAG